MIHNPPYPSFKIVPKTANQTVNNSTTLVSDTHLLVWIPANETWMITFVLFVQQGAAAGIDIKYATDNPAGSDVRGASVDRVPGQAYATRDDEADLSSNEEAVITYRVIIVNGATAGNVTLEWAQKAAGAIDTIVKAGSHLIAYKVR